MLQDIQYIVNQCKVTVEGVDYWFRESYILNGSGYSFGIYKTSKFSQRRNNVYSGGFSFNIFIIIGKYKNYILRRIEDGMHDLKFEEIEAHEKYILKLEKHPENNGSYWIKLNNDILISFYVSYWGDDNVVTDEMKLAKFMFRKQKLIRLNGIN